MKQAVKVDETGKMDFSTITSFDSEIPEGYVLVDHEKINSGEVVFDSEKGREMTAAEIEAARNTPLPKNEIDILKEENQLLKAQVQANADRADFQEELIVEMAMIVYP